MKKKEWDDKRTHKINWEFTRTRKRGPSNRPEMRSLRELKKGLTDGLKEGFWGIVSLRIVFYGIYILRKFNFLCLLFKATCLRSIAIYLR